MTKIFTRFIDVWKPDFLHRLLAEKSAMPTWIFWLVSNTVMALIITLYFTGSMVTAFYQAGEYLEEKHPDAAIAVVDGQLSTEGIDEPIFIEDKESNSVFILDTKMNQYDRTSLDSYDSGLLVTGEQLYYKDGVKREEYQFKDIFNETSFSFTQQDLQNWLQDKRAAIKTVLGALVFVASWFFLNGFRLLTALWWAFIFWLVGKAMKVELTYPKVYLAVLNFYIIVLLIEALLWLLGLVIPFSTTLIFAVIFVLNYQKLKQVGGPTPATDEAVTTPADSGQLKS